MAFLGRNGSIVLNLTAGQSLAVGSFGPGNAKISTGAFINSNLPPVYSIQQQFSGTALYLTYAAATNVLIEAANGCELEYALGSAPSLTLNPFLVTTGIVAHAGGGQALATPLTGNINRVLTVATAADSVLLPIADYVGKPVEVFNQSANAMNVYPQTGDAIGGGAANAAFSVPAGKGADFIVAVTNAGGAGIWNINLSA